VIEYLDLSKRVLLNGSLKRNERTGTNTISFFGENIVIDMSNGFPLLTSKKMAFKTMTVELEWFLHGRTDLKFLLLNNCHIWSSDAFRKFGKDYADYLGIPFESFSIKDFEFGVLNDTEYFPDGCDLGPIYGSQWRGKYGIATTTGRNTPDQLQALVDGLKRDPFGRRHLVVSWNPLCLEEMTLPPCHMSYQLNVREVDGQKYLDLKWSQRSGDLALGVPVNIASYGLLLMLIAKEVDMIPGFLIGDFGDLHVYEEHVENLKLQCSKELFKLPSVDISGTSLFDFDHKKVTLNNYVSNEKILYKLFT